MSDSTAEVNDIAEALEAVALQALPRRFAALVLSIAAARVVGETPEPERAKARALAERGLRETLAEYGHDHQLSRQCP